MIAAGQLSTSVSFRRRAAPVGLSWGGFEDIEYPVWAEFKEGRGEVVSFAGMSFPSRSGMLTVRDDEFVRCLGSGDRVGIEGAEFDLQSVVAPGDGAIVIRALEAITSKSYESVMAQRGEMIRLRRGPSDAPIAEVTARARVEGYRPDELVGGIQQGDRKVILLAKDATTFPLPIKVNDGIMVRGRRLNVQSVDDSTHRSGGELLAYEIIGRG